MTAMDVISTHFSKDDRISDTLNGDGTSGDQPAMSFAEIEARLTAPGQRFEIEEAHIRGRAVRTWKNAPRTLAALVRDSADQGEREFLVYRDERVTYDAHFRAVCYLAHGLVAAGVTKGDRVAFAMRNLPEWPVLFFAVASIGAIAVPLNAWWLGDELAYAIEDCGARLLVLDGERHDRFAALPDVERIFVTRPVGPLRVRAERFDGLLPSTSEWRSLPVADLPAASNGIEPDDDVAIFYTSGTTGAPKGAVGTHRNMATNILTTGYCAARAMLRRGAVPSERPVARINLLGIPFFHVTACSAALMNALASVGKLVLMHKWDVEEALRLIAVERVQVTGGVPALAWELTERFDPAVHDLSSLELVQYGGAPASPELVRRLCAMGVAPGNGWGMTETMATVTLNLGEDYAARPESCGAPVPVADIKIMSPDGRTELPTGEVGELWARGPMVVKGYWNRPDATAATFVDGWVRTGDLARLDAEGFCTIVDRLKDVIIRGGENIYSVEVENVLLAHPAVLEAALIAIPHAMLGEEPVAVVRLRDGHFVDEGELKAWLANRLAAFKLPVAIRFTDAGLPRNAVGKLLKSDVRGMLDD